MSGPFVGLPAAPEATGCLYAGIHLDGPPCDKPGTRHLAVRAAGWGLVGLIACDDHEDIARVTGTVIGEHPIGPDCAGDCWPEEVTGGE